jgi:hypothetical protein
MEHLRTRTVDQFLSIVITYAFGYSARAAGTLISGCYRAGQGISTKQ